MLATLLGVAPPLGPRWVPPRWLFSVGVLGAAPQASILKLGLTWPNLLREADSAGLPFMPADTYYFLGRDHVVVSRKAGMAGWRKRLFAYLDRNQYYAAQHFGLPPAKVTEIGEQIDI